MVFPVLAEDAAATATGVGSGDLQPVIPSARLYPVVAPRSIWDTATFSVTHNLGYNDVLIRLAIRYTYSDGRVMTFADQADLLAEETTERQIQDNEKITKTEVDIGIAASWGGPAGSTTHHLYGYTALGYIPEFPLLLTASS